MKQRLIEKHKESMKKNWFIEDTLKKIRVANPQSNKQRKGAESINKIRI